MMLELIKFEVLYRAKRADTYLYFLIIFLYSIIAIDFIYEGDTAPIHKNAPFIIAKTLSLITAFFLVVVSMITGMSALRDFDHRMESLMFINPMPKRDYLFGKFIGSFIVVLFVFSGALLGIMIGDFMPWKNELNMGPFYLWKYLQPFLTIVLPTLFFSSAVFFVSGLLSRKLMVVYTQGVILLMAYIFSFQLISGQNQQFAALLDPFMFQTSNLITQYWSVHESNTQLLSLEGVLLSNRIVWTWIGVIALIIGYYRFDFQLVKNSIIKAKTRRSVEQNNEKVELVMPHTQIYSGWNSKVKQFWHHTFFYFHSILKETSFWAIVICAMAIMFGSSINLSSMFGVDSYPQTHLVVGELSELSMIFFLVIVIFFSGELIWKERGAKFDLISDATPSRDLINIGAKFLGLVMIYIVLILAMILAGIGFQAMKGYYQFELDVYFIDFFVGLLPFMILFTFISFFFQVLLNHKFLAHLLVVVFLFSATILVIKGLESDHPLMIFGGDFLDKYSDMNGYGHFLRPYIWYKVYWLTFGLMLFVCSVMLAVRGIETKLKYRWQVGKLRFDNTLKVLMVSVIVLFISSGSYVFYNTNILNEYSTPGTQRKHRAAYEKQLKSFEGLPQPKIVDVELTLDLFPEERNFNAAGTYKLVNHHTGPIHSIHLQILPSDEITLKNLQFDASGKFNSEYEFYSYHIYELDNAMQPGDTVKMDFDQQYTTTGFSTSDNNQIVYNGTFFDNFFFPTIGYNENIELTDKQTREQFGLPAKARRSKIDDAVAQLVGRSGGDGEEINLEITLGTSGDQIAVAPGDLQATWEENGRSYFHYQTPEPISNFYSIVSARYDTVRTNWKAGSANSDLVDLEIYYHKGHEYNLDRMMHGMEASLDYCSEHFSPYQFSYARILEFPGYRRRAQSFPGTVPYSEGIGFVMDIDEDELDMAFFVTAHEMSHQWWGHQINPANVQGMSMISESLAQYSALMVMKEVFPEQDILQLVGMEMKRYLRGRSEEKEQEMPLSLVESGEQYIHYGKGLVCFNTLQHFISGDSVNHALSRFIKDWSSFKDSPYTGRYPTTNDLMPYLRDVTPDSLQNLVTDLFERVTIYDFKAKSTSLENLSTGQNKVVLNLESTKVHMDTLGLENEVPLAEWVDIACYVSDENGDDELLELQTIWVNQPEMSVQLITHKVPTKIVVDPFMYYIDKKPDNNSTEVSGNDKSHQTLF